MKRLISSLVFILVVIFFDLVGANVDNPPDPSKKFFLSLIKPDSKIILKWDSLKIVNPKNEQDFYYIDATVTVYIIDSVALFNYARSTRQSFFPDKFFTKQFISGLISGADLNKREYVSELYYSKFYYMLLIDGNASLTYEKLGCGLRIMIKAVKAVPDKYPWVNNRFKEFVGFVFSSLIVFMSLILVFFYNRQGLLALKRSHGFERQSLKVLERITGPNKKIEINDKLAVYYERQQDLSEKMVCNYRKRVKVLIGLLPLGMLLFLLTGYLLFF